MDFDDIDPGAHEDLLDVAPNLTDEELIALSDKHASVEIPYRFYEDCGCGNPMLFSSLNLEALQYQCANEHCRTVVHIPAWWPGAPEPEDWEAREAAEHEADMNDWDQEAAAEHHGATILKRWRKDRHR